MRFEDLILAHMFVKVYLDLETAKWRFWTATCLTT